ncbi:pentapeptide repeat-containing protein [Prosthecobacter sp.]|uniref:pentapeptide repeat-containing protein n=1 Tax=Prosthecobacter sp. TaxID=1965333 RepID=UPI003783EA2A
MKLTFLPAAPTPRKLLSAAFLLISLATSPAFADGKDFHDQDLKSKDFSRQALNGANFEDAVLDHAVFANASLKKASFKDASLDFVSFYMADLSEADLSGATGTMVLSNVNLSKANLEATGDPNKVLTLNLSTEINLRGANLKKCKIINVGYKCDLSGADLRGTNLRGGNISDTASLKKAIYDDDTAWPNGFDPVAAGCVMAKESAAEKK